MKCWEKDEWTYSEAVEEDKQMVEEEGWKDGGIVSWAIRNDK